MHEMQDGFRSGRGGTDDTFIVRQMHKNILLERKLHFIFVDLEKALDRVPRDVIKRAMWRLEVEEWLVRVVMDMYEGATTLVRVKGKLREQLFCRCVCASGICLKPLTIYYSS